MSVVNGSAFTQGRIVLAADARLSQPDYANDISWELSFGRGDSFPFALNSTFGLRARSMRMFPRLISAESGPANTSNHDLNLQIQCCYPNYLRLVCTPLPGIDLSAELWVPSSHVITGQFDINNRSILRHQLRFDWAALLTPMAQGHGMAAVPMEKTHVLEGKTHDLCPVCFLTGGPKPGPSSFPTLGYDLDLYPGNDTHYRWALGVLATPETSLALAQTTVARNWEPEIARLELVNASQQVKISTGDPAWNRAFSNAQRTAFQLFFPAGGKFPAPSFVQARNPDRGRSLRGDGGDYDPRWSGQTALDAWYLNNFLLPAAPDLAAGILDNFLAVQDTNGEIDWKPGLANQRMRMQAQPLLATMALQVQDSRPNTAWLGEIFPGLVQFFNSWFLPSHDQDGDGFPEWQNRIQIGLDDHPLFDRWMPANQGVDPSDVETPVLAAMLYNEAQSLIKIAAILNRSDEIENIRLRSLQLVEQVESTWDELENTYCYRDMLTGRRPQGVSLLSFHGSGQHELHQVLDSPQKLLLFLHGDSSGTRHANFTICGRLDGALVEELITPGQVQWMNRIGHAVTQSRFSEVGQVLISGLPEDDHGRLRTADLTRKDITLLLPLWARIPSRDRARQMVQETILPQFAQAYGMPVCPSSHLLPEQQHLNRVFLAWNQFILEGLVEYGFQETAADIFTRLMTAICQNTEMDSQFRENFAASNGKPGGDANTLASLPPVGLFLKILGIQKISPGEIILQMNNPFPWPVTVQYQGTRLSFFADRTEISTTNGTNITLDTPGPHRIILP